MATAWNGMSVREMEVSVTASSFSRVKYSTPGGTGQEGGAPTAAAARLGASPRGRLHPAAPNETLCKNVRRRTLTSSLPYLDPGQRAWFHLDVEHARELDLPP